MFISLGKTSYLLWGFDISKVAYHDDGLLLAVNGSLEVIGSLAILLGF